MTDIKRLKEIESKLQAKKEILERQFKESKFKDESIRQKLIKINGQITDIQIPIIEYEIKQQDKLN